MERAGDEERLERGAIGRSSCWCCGCVCGVSGWGEGRGDGRVGPRVIDDFRLGELGPVSMLNCCCCCCCSCSLLGLKKGNFIISE